MKPWFERDLERYSAEREFWTKHDFTESRDGDELVFRGVVALQVSKAAGQPYDRHEFELTITYLEGFPYVAPEVAFIDPVVRRHRHQGPGGKPCLFPDEAWHRDQPPSQFLKALRSWLHAYLVGEFPRELAIYEFPEYLDPSLLTILGPPGMTEAAAGHASGKFRVTELVGLDLAVLTHLQGADIGSAMLASLRMRRGFKRQERTGIWYRLHGEPEPPRLTTELADILAANAHGTVVIPPRESPRLLGLHFVDRVLDQPRWVFLDVGVENPKKLPPKGARKVRGVTFHPLSHQELFRRLRGVTDTETLAEREVAIFGLGAIGSHAALALAREGVGELTLCDPDSLRPGNVVRHALDLSDVGQLKAVAMEAAVHRVNPFIDTGWRATKLRDPARLDELVATPHLVISAIGDDAVEEQLNEVAVRSLVMPPVLYVRTLHAGDAIRIILVRPYRDACFTCLMLHREDEHPDWVTVPGSELPAVRDEGCAAPAPVGAGLASEHAALLVVRRAVDLLTRDDDCESNHWLWLERPITGIEVQRTPEPGVLRADRFERHPACPVCGNG